MIWQLVRRDQDWRMLGLMALCLWVGTVAGTVFSHPRVTAESLFSSMLPNMLFGCLVLGFMFGANRRATLFQAALPIPARDLLVARLLSYVAGLWFILLSTAAACYVVGSGRSISWMSLIMAAAMAAVTYLALLSLRLRELSVPTWMAFALLAGLGPAGYLMLFPGPLFSFARPGIVLPVCVVVFASLLWRDLASMPKAFQVTPLEPVVERPASHRAGSARPLWWPACRSAFYGRPSLFLIGLAMWLAMGMWPIASLMIAFFVDNGWANGWAPLRWLWPLPVDRRKVLAVMLLAPLLLSAAVQMAWPAGFVRAAELAALTLLFTSASLAMYKRNAWPAPARFVALLLYFVVSLGTFAMGMVDAHGKGPHSGIHARSYTADYLAAHLAKVPLDSQAILIAGALVALGALYWLVQRQFESADFVQSVQTRLDTTEYSTGFRA
jgi:hypothetical protein